MCRDEVWPKTISFVNKCKKVFQSPLSFHLLVLIIIMVYERFRCIFKVLLCLGDFSEVKLQNCFWWSHLEHRYNISLLKKVKGHVTPQHSNSKPPNSLWPQEASHAPQATDAIPLDVPQKEKELPMRPRGNLCCWTLEKEKMSVFPRSSHRIGSGRCNLLQANVDIN